MEERFTFGARNLDLLLRHKATLESFGYVCRVETATMTQHNFVLHTLVAVRPESKITDRYLAEVL